MVIFIKGMMCVRCTMAVQAVLERLGLAYSHLELGRVEINDEVTPEIIASIGNGLRYYELELINDRSLILVERIKIAVLAMFDDTHHTLPPRFSEHLSKSLFYNYTHLSNVFSAIEHSTIERYYIETRLRKAKDLLLYDNNSINSVAAELGFNSAAHFCLQFKKLTGYTPRNFRKELRSETRSPGRSNSL